MSTCLCYNYYSLAYFIPSDVWASVVLEMLDACDVVTALKVVKDAPLPAGAPFVARRVLQQKELDWFAMHSIRVELAAEMRHQGVGRIVWTLNGKAHRDGDLPAVITDDQRFWYRHGLRHREGGRPAVESDRGDKEWWVNGKRHRDGDLPATIHFAHTQYMHAWWVNGKRHRDGGLPAVELSFGDRHWWVNGKRHRDGGLPAVVCADHQEWWVNGKRQPNNNSI